MEKREPLLTFGGIVNWCSHYGKQYAGSSKIKKKATSILMPDALLEPLNVELADVRGGFESVSPGKQEKKHSSIFMTLN